MSALVGTASNVMVEFGTYKNKKNFKYKLTLIKLWKICTSLFI